MTDVEEPLFPPGMVSQALNIPAGTLATWARRGWMANFDAAFAEGRGKPRMFTLPDVLALALLKFASDHGTTQPEIISYAPKAAEDYLDHPDHLTHLVVRWYREPSSCSIRYNDNIMKDPPDPNPEFMVSFDLKAIFGEARRAIEAEAKAKAATLERRRRLEEISPTLPKISRTFTFED